MINVRLRFRVNILSKTLSKQAQGWDYSSRLEMKACMARILLKRFYANDTKAGGKPHDPG